MPARKIKKEHYRMFLSNASTALLIAFLVIAFLYMRSVHLVKRQQEEAAFNIARSQQQLMDRLFVEMNLIATQIEVDPTLSNYYISGNGYETYLGMRQLTRYLAANDNLTNVCFVFRDGHVLSASGTLDLNDFVARYDISGLENAYGMLLDGTLKNKPMMYPVGEGGHFLVVFPAPLIGTPKARLLAFVVKKARMDALFEPAVNGERADFAITDTDGQMLYHYRAGSLPEEKGGLKLLRNDSYAIAARYHYWYDSDEGSEQFHRLTRSFLLIALVTVLAAAGLAFFMTRWQYQPVKRLLALVPDGQAGAAGRLDDVQKYMADMMERNIRMAQQMKSYATLTRDYVLEQALLGRGENEQLSLMLRGTGILFPAPYFTVFRFLMAAKRPADADEPRASLHAPLRAEALERIQEAVRGMGSAQSLEWHDASLVLILNHNQRELDKQAVYAAVCARLGEELAITGGCGATVERLTQLQYSLYEAISACEMAHFSLTSFLDAAQYEQQVQREQTLKLIQAEQLVEAVKLNDRAAITRLIEGCRLEWLKKHAGISSLQIQTMGLINHLVELQDGQIVEMFDQSVREMLSSKTIDAYFQTMESICFTVGDELSARRACQQDALMARITRCIQQDFSSPNLSVQSVADQLQMSPSYLRRCMRERMNTTPAKYIDRVRMDEAKRMLQGGTCQIKEIALSVGYADVSSFVRKFKSETGYTPMQYRNASQTARA